MSGASALGCVTSPVSTLARQGFPKHDGRRVHIGFAIRRTVLQLLGRDVRHLPAHLTFARDLGATRGLGDAEVEHAGDAVHAYENVLRRNVAMDDAERLAAFALGLVSGMQPVEHRRQDRARNVTRDTRAVRLGDMQETREGLALHVLHDEEQLALRSDHVQRRHHVRVPDARRESRLVQKHRDELRVLRELRVQAFDRDRAREPDGPDEASDMDGCHAATGDLVEQRIASDEFRPVCRRLACHTRHGT